MKCFYGIRICIFLLSISHFSYSNILYVSQTAGGNNSGTSWTDAYLDLQEALSTAVSGDTIAVARGIYLPHVSDATVSFNLQNQVTLLGGFAGDEEVSSLSVLSGRDFFANETILSGDLLGDDVGLENNRSDNSLHVVKGLTLDSTATLNGFTISGGEADGTGNDIYGGGLYLDHADLTIANCKIVMNRASSRGGGMYLYYASCKVINTVISNNFAVSRAGGVYPFLSGPTFINTIIRNNQDNGTSNVRKNLYNSSSTPTFFHCNIAYSGGSAGWYTGYGTDLGNNIDLPAGMLDIDGNDVRLYQASPLINAGDVNHGVNIGQYQGAGEPNPPPIFVKADALGSGDGSSWANAMTHLQQAMDAAGDYQPVYVSKGVYLPHATLKDSSFVLREGVVVYGGFSGNEGEINDSVIDARDLQQNASILSGDLNGDDLGLENNEDNAEHVILADNVSAATILDGFTIAGGNAISGAEIEQGGGIALSYAYPVFRNISIVNNYGYYWGGAVYAYYSGPTFINCTFTNNETGYFGGAVCTFLNGSSPTTFNNCIISGNKTGYNAAYRNAYSFGGTITYKHSLVEGSGGSTAWNTSLGTDAGFNVDGSTDFVDITTNDIRLFEGSSALFIGDTVNGTHAGQYQGEALPRPVVTFDQDSLVFGTILLGQQATEDSVIVSADHLLNNLVITAGTDFHISLTKGVYSQDTITLVPDNGRIGPVTVYVSFEPLSAGDLDSWLLASSVMADDSVILKGAGQQPVSFSINANLSTFDSTHAGQYSTDQLFTVSGAYLEEDIQLSVATGFKLSLTGGLSFSGSSLLILSPVNGTLDEVTVYVRFAPETDTTYTGFIMIQGQVGITDSIAVSGIGTLVPAIPTIVLTGDAYHIFNDTWLGASSAEFSYEVSGQNLADDITLTAPDGFEISLVEDDFSGNTTTIALGQSEGTVSPTTIYVRFNPQQEKYYNAYIVHASENAGDQYMNVRGDGVLPPFIYVNQAAQGNNNGTSWDDAFTSLTDAIASAESGDVIYVAAGIYKPHAINRSAYFSLTPGVAIYGGFEGGEGPIDNLVLQNRDFVLNETILSGDLNGDDNAFDGNAENSYNVVKASAAGQNIFSTTILDGFTITGGNANGSWPDPGNGGAIYLTAGASNRYCNPVLSNLNITYNYGDVFGGAVHINPYSNNSECSPMFYDCRFSYNHSGQDGGAVHVQGIVGSCNPYFNKVVFNHNQADHRGGAVYNEGACNGEVHAIYENVLFHHNSANTYGGAIANVSTDAAGSCQDIAGLCAPSIINATFVHNTSALSFGNAVYNNQDLGSCTPTYINTIVYGNGTGVQFYNNNGALPVVSHSLLQGSGGSTSWDVTFGSDDGNNLDGNPLFASAENGDVALLSGSPALLSGHGAHGSNIGYYQGSAVTTSIQLSGANALSFGQVMVGETSIEQNYSVSAFNLPDDLLVIAPEGYQIALISGQYTGKTDTLRLQPAGGQVNATTIYARFNPTQAKAYASSIQHICTGANTQLLPTSGTGVIPPYIFVKADATGLNNGTSWADAFTDLQDALSAAVNGDMVCVAQGTYTPSIASRTTPFKLINGVMLYGGFAGSEYPVTSDILQNRDFGLNETILSGDLNSDDSGLTNNDENSYQVVVGDAGISNLTASTILDGFTIRGGNANGTYPNPSGGGGIYLKGDYNRYAKPTLRNLVVEYNYGKSFGGGLLLFPYTNNGEVSPVIEDCLFRNNSCGQDGGAVCLQSIVGNCSPQFSNVIFRTNSAGARGGAVFNQGACDGVCTPKYKDVLFDQNTGGYSGGGAMYNESTDAGGSCVGNGGSVSVTLINATFVNNKGTLNRGSAIYNEQDLGSCSLEMINTIIWGNAGSDQVYNLGAVPQVSYSLIEGSGGSASWVNGYGNDLGNNLDTDPLFADLAGGNVALTTNSPALNSGNTSYGNNIGYDQDTGVAAIIALKLTADVTYVNQCATEALEQITLTVTDELPGNVVLSASSSNQIMLADQNLTITGSGETRFLSFEIPHATTGETTITLTATNEGEADALEIVIHLLEKPVVDSVWVYQFNTQTQDYTLYIAPDESILYDSYYFDNDPVYDNMPQTSASGLHQVQTSNQGCLSEPYYIDLLPYINEVELEIILSADTISACYGDDLTSFPFTVLDDAPQNLTIQVFTSSNMIIEDAAISVVHLSGADYELRFGEPAGYGLGEIQIIASNQWGEQLIRYVSFNIYNPNAESLGRDGGYCINPQMEDPNMFYNYLKIRFDEAEPYISFYVADKCLEAKDYQIQFQFFGCESEVYPLLMADTSQSDTGNYISETMKIEQHLRIYPNPTREVLTVEAPIAGKQVVLSVSTMENKVIWTREMTTGTAGLLETIDISELAGGIYHLRMACHDAVFVRKVVKQ